MVGAPVVRVSRRAQPVLLATTPGRDWRAIVKVTELSVLVEAWSGLDEALVAAPLSLDAPTTAVPPETDTEFP